MKDGITKAELIKILDHAEAGLKKELENENLNCHFTYDQHPSTGDDSGAVLLFKQRGEGAAI